MKIISQYVEHKSKFLNFVNWFDPWSFTVKFWVFLWNMKYFQQILCLWKKIYKWHNFLHFVIWEYYKVILLGNGELWTRCSFDVLDNTMKLTFCTNILTNLNYVINALNQMKGFTGNFFFKGMNVNMQEQFRKLKEDGIHFYLQTLNIWWLFIFTSDVP